MSERTIVTITFETDAPYTKPETQLIAAAVKEVVTETDLDAIPSSFTTLAETESERTARLEQEFQNKMNDADITGTLLIAVGNKEIEIELVEAKDED